MTFLNFKINHKYHSKKQASKGYYFNSKDMHIQLWEDYLKNTISFGGIFGVFGHLKNTYLENKSGTEGTSESKRGAASTYWFEKSGSGWLADYAVRVYFGFSVFGKFKNIMFQPAEIE